MALYGAPVWADALNKRENAALLRRPQRAIAQRVATRKNLPHGRAHCDVRPRWYSSLGARSWGLVCRLSLDGRPEGAWKAPGPGAVRRRHEDMTRAQLAAIGPVLDQWLERPHGFLTFRLAQVLTGHGCFGSYLQRIGREESPCVTNVARRMTRCSTPSRSAQAGLAPCPHCGRGPGSFASEPGHRHAGK
ncbi:uncharacterized protein LOC135074849 [Ostrinia nubilalis]|uniref:uncharacterized protein LOC135074849 n=1 Tax=Ostrinia nubilalis TaxID=29057 RepID=UPI0030822043